LHETLGFAVRLRSIGLRKTVPNQVQLAELGEDEGAVADVHELAPPLLFVASYYRRRAEARQPLARRPRMNNFHY
jgi:hypothetical protein